MQIRVFNADAETKEKFCMLPQLRKIVTHSIAANGDSREHTNYVAWYEYDEFKHRYEAATLLNLKVHHYKPIECLPSQARVYIKNCIPKIRLQYIFMHDKTYRTLEMTSFINPETITLVFM